jgi:hypothetical protein
MQSEHSDYIVKNQFPMANPKMQIRNTLYETPPCGHSDNLCWQLTHLKAGHRGQNPDSSSA